MKHYINRLNKFKKYNENNKLMLWFANILIIEKKRRKKIKKSFKSIKKPKSIAYGLGLNNTQYYGFRLKNDLDFRLKHNLRSRFYNAIKRNSKKSSVIDHIGCSIDQLKAHLESKFQPGMTWENYGPVWEIDHIVSLCNYDLSKLENLNNAWNFNNLQPLFKKQNRTKKKKVDHLTTYYRI